jgi:oxalate decarboxylase/phosphoglucose isomerase-like protein (cupin superfamily)
MPSNYSPVNFDNYDEEAREKYPLFAEANVLKVRVENGDCLFLPSNWWHRVTSAPEETIAVSHWYYSHS